MAQATITEYAKVMAPVNITEYAEVVDEYSKAHTNYKSLFFTLIKKYQENGVSTDELVQDMGQGIEDMGQLVARLEHHKNLLEIGAHPKFNPNDARSMSDWSLTISEHRKNLEHRKIEWAGVYTYWVNKAKGN